MENYEIHKELMQLPEFVFPIAMLVFGYSTMQQKEREQPERFDQRFIVFENQYRRLELDEFEEMFKKIHDRMRSFNQGKLDKNYGQILYTKKYTADFTKEMNRSVRAALKNWESKDK